MTDLLIIGAAAVALFLALFFSAQAGLFTIAAAWVAAAAWRYPKETFFLLIFFAPLLPILKATQVLGAITPLKDVVIIALLFRTTIVPLALKRDPYRRNTLFVPLVLLASWAILGLLRADDAVLGVLRLRDILLYLPMLWIARSLMGSEQDLRMFLRMVLGGAVFVLLLAGVQFLAFPDGMVLRYHPALRIWIPRVAGVLAHPNLLASYLLFIVPLVCSLFLARSFSRAAKALLAFFVGLGLVATYFTYSRSGWIAIAGALSALFGLVLLKRRTLILPGVFAVSAVLVLLLTSVPGARTFLQTVVDPTYASNEERIHILASLIANSSSTSALIGEGLGDVLSGTLRTVRISLNDIAEADVRRVQIAKAQTFVDNAVLKTGVELGVVGLALLLWIVGSALGMSWKECRTGTLPEGRAVGIAVFSTTIGLLVLSFFLDVPEIFPVALFWWSFVGVLQALPYITVAFPRSTPR